MADIDMPDVGGKEAKEGAIAPPAIPPTPHTSGPALGPPPPPPVPSHAAFRCRPGPAKTEAEGPAGDGEGEGRQEAKEGKAKSGASEGRWGWRVGHASCVARQTVMMVHA